MKIKKSTFFGTDEPKNVMFDAMTFCARHEVGGFYTWVKKVPATEMADAVVTMLRRLGYDIHKGTEYDVPITNDNNDDF